MRTFFYLAAVVAGLVAGWRWRQQAIRAGQQRALVNLLTVPAMLEMAGVALVIALLLVPVGTAPTAVPATAFAEEPAVPDSVTVSAPGDDFPLDEPESHEEIGERVEEAV